MKCCKTCGNFIRILHDYITTNTFIDEVILALNPKMWSNFVCTQTLLSHARSQIAHDNRHKLHAITEMVNAYTKDTPKFS